MKNSLIECFSMDISHFIKVTCNGRKVAVHCDGNTYDEFLKNVSEKFNIPENNIEITTSDNTEVDNVYFNAIVKSVDQLNARDRTECESKASTEFSLQSPLQSPTSSISSRSCISPLETGTQATIQIPWNKIPSSLNQAFEEEELITRKQRCLLIKILWDEIKQTNQRISRKILREVAAKVVRRHPRCFEKRMDGTILTDGIEELMLALEAKKDNENRPESCEKSKKPRLDIEVINSESFNQNELKDLFLKDKLTDVEKQKVRETMISTYQAQRIDFIDKDTTICMVKASWPFIFQSDYFFKHFEMLTSVNLLKLFNGIGEIQSVRIYNYLVAQKTCNLSEIQNLQEQPDITWTYQMLTQVFKEDLKELIVCQIRAITI
ncbi:uncharacterized protein LOC126821300 [Patella vulgata]|uniref:uncharacterized protein LOC126821300 n=1 Tax=Patella vulgata TaxID=6465 RepID=UPI00217FF79A|nr:uncharacterized protein LOC126821300 [Patella vulgata]